VIENDTGNLRINRLLIILMSVFHPLMFSAATKQRNNTKAKFVETPAKHISWTSGNGILIILLI
jgi:hypothetical protein